MGSLFRACLPLALLAGLSLVAPEVADASQDGRDAVCKKKKKRRKKRRVKKRTKKVTARTIKQWQKRGVPHSTIVERAQTAGYKVTKRERRKLKRLRVKRRLIAKLSNASVPAVDAPQVDVAAAKPTQKQPINLDNTIDPNEIDFDSIPPPQGMPEKYARDQRARAKSDKKRSLDQSMRPSAFDSGKSKKPLTSSSTKKKPLVAKK